MAVIDITNDELDRVLAENEVVLLDLWASWCAPCRMMKPIFAAVSEKVEGVTFAKIQIDDDTRAAERYGVMSIPTFLLFKKGELVLKHTGSMSAEELEALLK